MEYLYVTLPRQYSIFLGPCLVRQLCVDCVMRVYVVFYHAVSCTVISCTVMYCAILHFVIQYIWSEWNLIYYIYCAMGCIILYYVIHCAAYCDRWLNEGFVRPDSGVWRNVKLLCVTRDNIPSSWSRILSGNCVLRLCSMSFVWMYLDVQCPQYVLMNLDDRR